MKIIFSFLLISNIIFAIIVNYQSGQQDIDAASSAFNPEKINMLPPYVDCMVWRDFTGPKLQQAKAAIKKLELLKPYKLVLSSSKTKFWIHTSPYENQQAAERAINKLRNMGIISYRIQDKGPWLNAISFGKMKNNAAANTLADKLNQKGLTKVTISRQVIEYRKFLFFEADTHQITELQNLASQFPDSRLAHTICERL